MASLIKVLKTIQKDKDNPIAQALKEFLDSETKNLLNDFIEMIEMDLFEDGDESNITFTVKDIKDYIKNKLKIKSLKYTK